jgi:hypothetical protein
MCCTLLSWSAVMEGCVVAMLAVLSQPSRTDSVALCVRRSENKCTLQVRVDVVASKQAIVESLREWSGVIGSKAKEDPPTPHFDLQFYLNRRSRLISLHSSFVVSLPDLPSSAKCLGLSSHAPSKNRPWSPLGSITKPFPLGLHGSRITARAAERGNLQISTHNWGSIGRR